MIARDTGATHSLSLTFSNNDLKDRNIITREYGAMKAMLISFNHMSSFSRKNNSLQSGLQYSRISMQQIDNTQWGFTVGYGQALFSERLNLSLSGNYNWSFIKGSNDGNVLNGTASLSYTAGGRHTFSAASNIIRTTSKQYENFTETSGTLGYHFLIR